MATKNTVNVQRMRSSISELGNIQSNMQKQLDETMSSLKKVWTGEAANAYLKSYQKNLKSFQDMAGAITSAIDALEDSCVAYETTDARAMDIVEKLGKRG